MKKEFNDDDILATPLAEGACVFFCPNHDCNQPHILLLDEDYEPIAHYVVGDEFFAELAAAMQRRKNQ